MEAERQEASNGVATTTDETDVTSWTLRSARLEDATGIARILVEAFPGLYRSTFGRFSREQLVALIAALYYADHLSLDATRIFTAGERVIAVMILHTGLPIGRGSARSFWRLLQRRYGLLGAMRPFFGGVMANLMLDRRIPRAPDLVYIEALAVAASERGKGLGTRLLVEAEQWTRARQRSRLALHVLTSNSGARRLYERMGFRPWSNSRTSFSWDSLFASPSSWSAILMARSLEEA